MHTMDIKVQRIWAYSGFIYITYTHICYFI